MKFVVTAVLFLSASSALAFFEHLDPIPPIGQTPIFWGTSWKGPGVSLDITEDGSIYLNNVLYAKKMSGIPATGSHAIWGSKSRDRSTFCVIVERTAEIEYEDTQTILTLTEKVYEHESVSGGYLCGVFPDKRFYAEVSLASVVFKVRLDDQTMTAIFDGQTVTLRPDVGSDDRTAAARTSN